MTERTDKSAKEIIEEAGSIERFLSPEYQRQAAREYRERKLAQLAVVPESPRQLLHKAINGIDLKCRQTTDIMPEMMMLFEVLRFLNQPEVRAIQECAA